MDEIIHIWWFIILFYGLNIYRTALSAETMPVVQIHWNSLALE